MTMAIQTQPEHMAPTCQRCNEEVQAKTDRCPHCSWEPSKNGYYARIVAIFIGAALCLTVVGAVVGIPLIILAVYGEQKAQGMTVSSDVEALSAKELS